MTFKEFMQENGYELQTTFWEDFSISGQIWVGGCFGHFQPGFQGVERGL